jgi:hypothetical protein
VGVSPPNIILQKYLLLFIKKQNHEEDWKVVGKEGKNSVFETS